MEDVELHDATTKSVENSMQWLNKKRNVRNHQRKFSKPNDSNKELGSRIQICCQF